MDRQSFVDWSFRHYLEIAPPGFCGLRAPACLKNAGARRPTTWRGRGSLPSLLLRPAIAVLGPAAPRAQAVDHRAGPSSRRRSTRRGSSAPEQDASDRLQRQGARGHRGDRRRRQRRPARPRDRALARRPRRRARRRGDLRTLPAARRRRLGARPPLLDAADARVGSRLGTALDVEEPARVDLDPAVAAEAGRTRPAPLDAYGHLTAATVALIVQAGNESNLILDPDLDSLLRDGRAGQQGAARARQLPGASAAARSPMVASGHSTEAKADRPRRRPGGALRAPSRPPRTGPRARPTPTPTMRPSAPALDPALAQVSGTSGLAHARTHAPAKAWPRRGPRRRSSARTPLGGASRRCRPAWPRRSSELLAARVDGLRASARRAYVVVGTRRWCSPRTSSWPSSPPVP